MDAIVIVTCLRDQEQHSKELMGFADLAAKVFSKIRGWVLSITGRKKPERLLKGNVNVINLKNIQLPEVHLLTIPLQVRELEKMSKAWKAGMADYIREYCSSRSATMLAVPDAAARALGISESTCSSYYIGSTGKNLFRALFTSMLDEIFTNRGISIRELEISIIKGASNGELFELIGLIADRVKYVTILTADREELEQDVEVISDETGLCISVTEDRTSGLRNAEVIVNLGEISYDMAINSSAVIVNYGTITELKAAGSQSVINGIEVGLPVIISDIIPKETEGFSNTVLAEIMIYGSMERNSKASSLFHQAGFTITGFIGLRSLQRAHDIFQASCSSKVEQRFKGSRRGNQFR